ncbi:aliphatic sulfonate ABC transporter substrate-binding protein [Acinetobacter puyangensis]|uniref:aliphatic sulfonate ABC transporter substrate-binding protein n=1 Tax=Acinetobacter puyangensis TaxID=1096779 RepID=UPI003A4E28A4
MAKKLLLWFSVLMGIILLAACTKSPEPGAQQQSEKPATSQQVVRIGYQKSSTLLTLLKQSGELDQQLAKQGYKVSWHEFTSGLPLLEALNVGNIDVSADVADTVPVFAQAADAQITYYAKEAASPTAQAILIPANSEIKTLADLKGKKIAVTKAAGSHYLLIEALNKAGLSLKDITPSWLTPADGRAAFEHGSVAAWVTWEPYVSSGQIQQHAKILTTGEGLASYKRYYLASSSFTEQHPEVIEQIIAALKAKADWVKNSPEDAAKILAPLWGNLPLDVVQQANAHRSYQVEAVTAEDLLDQQKIADAFFKEGLLPKNIDAKSSQIFHTQP